MKTNNDKIFVQEIEVKDRKLGGIYIPNAIGLTIKKGEVVEVGPGRLNADGTRTPCSCKVGDIIMFAAHAGMPIEFKKNGETLKLLVMPDIEIIGTFESDEE
jgi:chaperonin GroES